MIEKNDESKNNPEYSSTTTVDEHISSGFLILEYSHLKSY